MRRRLDRLLVGTMAQTGGASVRCDCAKLQTKRLYANKRGRPDPRFAERCCIIVSTRSARAQPTPPPCSSRCRLHPEELTGGRRRRRPCPPSACSTR